MDERDLELHEEIEFVADLEVPEHIEELLRKRGTEDEPVDLDLEEQRR